jgi:hypothetical protein
VAGLIPSNAEEILAESEVMVAFKQSNNGTVYIWSPQSLPHLEEP